MAAWALWLNCWHRAAWEGEGASRSLRGWTSAQPASASRAAPHPAMTPRRRMRPLPGAAPGAGPEGIGSPPPPALDQDIDTITGLIERAGAGRPRAFRVSTGLDGNSRK